MKWVCPDCAYVITLRGNETRPVTVSAIDDRYKLDSLNENKCPECDSVKKGFLVGGCPNHGRTGGTEHVVFSAEKPEFHYCRKCSTHLYYEQDREDGLPRNASPFCPLCHSTKHMDELDYHHWNYQWDVGIHLCRECHNGLHDGKRAREQTAEATGDESWKVAALENLRDMHRKEHGEISSWVRFFDMYNLPSRDPEYAWLQQSEL